MPAFALPEDQLQPLARWVRSLNVSAYDLRPSGDVDAGQRFFFGKGQCASCHMVRGLGGSNGPDLSGIGRELTLGQLEQALDDPATRAANRSGGSCPSWAWCPGQGWSLVSVRLQDGSALRGFLRSQGKHDLQLQTLDGHLRLLLDTEYREISREKGSFMPAVTAGGRGAPRSAGVSQPSRRSAHRSAGHGTRSDSCRGDGAGSESQVRANGPPTTVPSAANRHSALTQINAQNVSRLKLAWTYTLPYVGLQIHAAGDRRRDVCHRAEPGVRPRFAHRPRDLVLFAAAQHRQARLPATPPRAPIAARLFWAIESSSPPTMRT